MLIKLLKHAAYAGATRALVEAGMSTPYVSRNRAAKIYGKGAIKLMIEQGLITPVKTGMNTSTIQINRTELDAAAVVLGLIDRSDT